MGGDDHPGLAAVGRRLAAITNEDPEKQYWHYETYTLPELESEPCMVYTSMAVPSLTNGGTYTLQQILDDKDGLLSAKPPIGEDGAVSVTYEFADKSHVLHMLVEGKNSTPIVDHLTAYQIEIPREPYYTDWATIDIRGDMSKAAYKMIIPEDNQPTVGSSFQLVTDAGKRGTFGSRVVTIPGSPSLEVDIDKTIIYGSEEGHNHNTVIRNDLTLTPNVLEMDYPSTMPPAGYHFIGVWRQLDREEIVNSAPRRIGEDDSDSSESTASEETLIHHYNEDMVNHTWCSNCQEAQGYIPGDESGVFTDHIKAEHSQANIAAKYRVRMFVQTPYDANQWMIAEAPTVEQNGILTDLQNIGIDSDTPIYFNLQGVRVINPRHGEFLIKVDRTGSHRIRYTEQ